MKALEQIHPGPVFTDQKSSATATAFSLHPAECRTISLHSRKIKLTGFWIVNYLREDICRSSFILFLLIVVISASFYNYGYIQKTSMQHYLIQREAETSKAIEADSLKYNLVLLTSLLQAQEKAPLNEVLRLQAIHCTLKIREFFSEMPPHPVHFYLLEKLSKLERTLFYRPASHSALKGYAADLRLLFYFAEHELSQRHASTTLLEKDYRKTLVGKVSQYNTIQDISLLLGSSFLILAIACIPGLGRQTQARFV